MCNCRKKTSPPVTSAQGDTTQQKTTTVSDTQSVTNAINNSRGK